MLRYHLRVVRYLKGGSVQRLRGGVCREGDLDWNHDFATPGCWVVSVLAARWIITAI